MANRILNIIGWIGTALVVVAIGIRLGLPAKDQYAYYLAWAGLVCMLAYTLSQWREIAGMFTRRQARYGTLTFVSIVAVLGILAAINYIGKRQNKRWDLTAAKQFSLSDQSRNVLAKLDAPLQVTVFAQDTAFQQYRDRLREYEYASKQVKTDYIDPEKKPAIAQQNQIQQLGTIMLQFKGRTERITSDTEQDITNGIIKVVTGQQKKVYFMQGHGEKDPDATARDGYSTINAALKAENYTVEKLVLAQTGAVPDDASVVVVAGPKTDLFAPEIDALKKYLGKSGKLLLLIDPPDPAKPESPLANVIALAHDWGTDVTNDIVVDASGMGRLFGAGPEVVVAANYPSHPITERFNILTAFPLARPVVPVSGGVNGHTAQTIVESSPRSWAEHDLKSLVAGEVSLDPSKGDKAGPVSLAAAVSASSTTEPPKPDAKSDAPKPETRVAVFGDADFATNAALGIQGNRDLFMNTVGWLSQQENLISIRPKEAADRRITMTAAQQININWISLLIIPGVVFASGVYSWWRRR
jgi:ABC-type uncharacterized transport system involved in gliding motility auxiliary subunit